MKKTIARISVLFLILTQSLTVAAKSAEQIEREKVEEERDKIEKELGNLQNEVGILTNEYNDYSSRYALLQKEVANMQKAIVQNSGDIQELSEELEEIEDRMKYCYDHMKQRITFTYENQNKPLIVVLLESKSFSDFINRVEFITSLMQYDKKTIEEYVTLNTMVNEKQDALEEKQNELNDNLKTAAKARAEMGEITTIAGEALVQKNEKVLETQMTLDEFNKKIKELREKEREIANRNAKAQLEQMQSIKEQIENGTIETENNSGAVLASEEEVMLLAATIQAEADGEGYEGRLGVASVIMNRVNSALFPNSISGVVYQNKQFSCVNYTLPLILARGANEGCIAVAREAIAGKRNTTALFFMTPEAANRLGQIGTPLGNGGHVFFDVWLR